MALANTYVQLYGQLGEFFSRIRQGQAPDQFTQQHLKDLGFTSSNYRAVIPLMKALGFLTPEGIPTPRYHEYRNDAQSRRVMGEALREAYGDLFVIKEKPTDADKPLIEGKFKSTHNVSDRLARDMASTFYALLALADISKAPPKAPEPQKTEKKREAVVQPPPAPDTLQTPPAALETPALHYNIQIHLPATKDIEVFNAIFRSLKEHLLER